VLERDGYERARLGDVCRRAGVSRTTFYAHFAGKRSLAARLWHDELAAVEALVERAERHERPWAEQLARALEELLADLYRSPESARERLLQAMIEIAGHRGFREATLSRLCRRAGVSATAFHRCFADRRDCLAAAVEAACRSLEACVDARLAGVDDSGSPAAAFLRALGEELAAQPHLGRLLLVEAATLEPPWPGAAGAGWAGSLRELIARRLGSCLPKAADERLQLAAGAAVAMLRAKFSPVANSTEDGEGVSAEELAQATLAPLVGRAEAERVLAVVGDGGDS
jgi:AcrR family transcriptional regulator